MEEENFVGSYDDEKRINKLKLLRNEFKLSGKYDMPLVKKQEVDLNKIDLWCYSKTKLNDIENYDKTIHFFTYDWIFDGVYDRPEKTMEKLDQYYALLTPEFSMYWDMPRSLQIYSVMTVNKRHIFSYHENG